MTNRSPGRPVILKVCVVCNEAKKTSLFPPMQTAAQPDRCKACSKLATEAAKVARLEISGSPAREAARLAKQQKQRDAALRKKEVAAERREEARLRKIQDSTEFAGAMQEVAERKATKQAMKDINDWFQANTIPNCGCCFALATGQDSIGLRDWCTLCGWGIERTGRCLAHPSEVFYPGLPQDVELPPELLATIRAPAMHQEAPSMEPDEKV